MSHSLPCPALPVVRRLLWLVLALMLARGQAGASPVIAVSPDSIGPVELPGGQAVAFSIRIHDRDSQGPAPLTWTMSDVLHGTNNDVPWVVQSPASGTVAPADSANVTLIVDTWGVPGGRYFVDLRIDSNDPVHPRIVIPMKLEVVVAVPTRKLTFGHLKARYR